MLRRTLFYDITLATLLAAGAQAVILMVLLLIDKPLERLFEPPNPGHLQVHRSGRIVLTQPAGGYHDLSGRPLDIADVLRWLHNDKTRDPWLSPVWLPTRHSQRQRLSRLGWYSRLLELPGSMQANWFVVHLPIEDSLAYLVGYDVATKERLGYLGQKGFSAWLPPQEEWFAMAGEPSTRLAASASGSRTSAGLTVLVSTPQLPPGLVYLAADERIWEVDLNARAVHVLFESPMTESMAAATGNDGQPELFVRTSTEVVAIDLQGKRRGSWKLPAKLRDEAFQWYELADGTGVAGANVHRQDTGTIYVDLTRVNHDGAVTGSEHFESRYGLPVGPRGTYGLLAGLAPTPLIFSYLAATMTPVAADYRGEQQDFPTALAYTLTDAWPAATTLYLLSAVLAWLAYRRQVRYALPGAGAWVVFVFLLGVPGWLAYRWHRRWPLLDSCGECHRPAPRDREACAACGKLFAPPPLLGTEIFA